MLSVHDGAPGIERAVLQRLFGAWSERVIEQRRDDGQHEQREADAEQADEGEELAAQQHLHREHEIVIEHGESSAGAAQFTWRPSNSRTIRSVCAAFCWSCVTITTVVLSSRFRVLRMRHDLVAHLRVEVAGRFVREQDARPADDRPGDGDALLLAARELRGKVVDACAQPDAVERFLGPLPPLRVRHPAIEQRNLHVVEHAEVADQVEHLEDEADLLVAHRGQGAVR